MGGCTSKQETSVKASSINKRRGRRSIRKERDEREKEMFNRLKEAEREWRKEKKKLEEEVKSLRMKLEEREEVKTTTEERDYWKWVIGELCVERVVRDEAVEKWKQLYLAIKNELDHLIIHTTSSGEAMMQRRLEEEDMEELRDEVRVKEETIETLKKKIALMDREKYEKERDIDLLRQSLRILGSKKKKKRKKTSYFASMNLLILKTKCVQST